MKLTARIKDILGNPFYQVVFILFFFEAVFVPSQSHMWDLWAFISWAKFIFVHGIGNIYKIGKPATFNYPPLISYLAYVFGLFEGSEEKIETYARFFKLFALAADFIAAVLLVKLLNNKKKEILFLLLLIANPLFIYNSYCWGQVDGILELLVFASFLSLFNKRLFLSAFFFTLAVNFKVHAIIFLPVLGLLAIYQYHRQSNIQQLAYALVTIIVTQFCILLPFILDGQLTNAWESFTGAVNYYPFISCNAFNIWVLLLPSTNLFGPDKQEWLGVAYKQWGLFMFILFYLLAVLPLFVSAVNKFITKVYYQIPLHDLLLTFALVPLVFFYFNTQMHERFGHTTMIFTAGYAFYTRRYWLFLIVCLAYFANLETIVHFFSFPNYHVVIFNPYWGALLYLLDILCLYYFLYRSFILQIKANRHETISQ